MTNPAKLVPSAISLLIGLTAIMLAARGQAQAPLAPTPPRSVASSTSTETLLGVSSDPFLADALIAISLTRTNGAYTVQTLPTGTTVAEDGWSESPRFSLSYRPYPELLYGLGNVRTSVAGSPWSAETAGTMRIDLATGGVSRYQLNEAGHSWGVDAQALAVNASGRTILSLGGALLSLNAGQTFWHSASFLHNYFTDSGAISALAFGPDGKLYGWAALQCADPFHCESRFGLVTVDPGFSGYINFHTDVVDVIGEATEVSLSSIEFTESGALIGIQPGLSSTSFYEIAVPSGALTLIGESDTLISSLARPVDWPAPNYVAMGDSFSSGEGAGAYILWTNRAGINECRRSLHAWSTAAPGVRSELRLETELGDLVRPAFVACSGAVIADLFESRNHPGEEWDDPPPPQLASLSPSIDLVALTLGGNDMGFGRLIRQCAFVHHCDSMPISAFDTRTVEEWALARIAAIAGSGERSLESAYAAAAELGAAVYVLGYPDVLADENFRCAQASWLHVPSVGRYLAATVPEGYPFQSSELRMFRRLGDALNEAIRCSAQRAGVHAVISEVEDAFAGHEHCAAGTPFINGVVEPLVEGFRADSLDGKEVLHPNRAGQAAYAQALNAYVGNLASPLENPAPAFCAPTADLSEKITAGPPVQLADLDFQAWSGSSCPGTPAFAPGQGLQVRGSGFAPLSTLTLKLTYANGSPAVEIREHEVDDLGGLYTYATLPADAPTPMPAVLEAGGLNAAGEPYSLVGYLVLVADPDEDEDQDGIADACDNCNEVPNPGQENTDGDAVGDTCDACPNDPENDIDGDGLCADIDPCPYVHADDSAGLECFRALFADDFETGGTGRWAREDLGGS